MNQKIEKYKNLLLEWNQKFSFFSRKSAKEEIDKHIQNSIDLASCIKNSIKSDKLIIDLGSGAGLPAIILSILLPNKVIAIESRKNKSGFLNFLQTKLELNNFEVFHGRIEDFEPPENNIIITAKAFADINKILQITENFGKNKTYYLPKGENLQNEINMALQINNFQYSLLPAKIGKIVKIENVKKA